MFTTKWRRSHPIPQSFNRYAYVGNDPVNFVDPTGLYEASGYGQKNQHEWAQHGRFELVASYLERAKGINLFTDPAIKETFRRKYKILLSDEELLAFSNFMAAHYPEHPSWSETNYFRDHSQINEAGNPLWVRTMKKPERFYDAYLEFKKTKR